MRIVERVEQDSRQRYVLLRLRQPAPGVALIVTYGIGDTTNASISFYLYGDDAGQRAAASESQWRDWLRKTFRPA